MSAGSLQKHMKWSVHSDLSGKCWIPDNTIPGKPGWYEDAPRRLYINTPWFHLGIAATPNSRYVSRGDSEDWTCHWVDLHRRHT